MIKNLHFWDDEMFDKIGELLNCDSSVRAEMLTEEILSSVRRDVRPWLYGKVEYQDIDAVAGYVMLGVYKSLKNFYNHENSCTSQKRKNWLITVTLYQTSSFLRDIGVIGRNNKSKSSSDQFSSPDDNSSYHQDNDLETSIISVAEYPDYIPSMSVDTFTDRDAKMINGSTLLKYIKKLFISGKTIDTAIVNFAKIIIKSESIDNVCTRECYNEYMEELSGSSYLYIKNMIVKTLISILDDSLYDEIMEIDNLLTCMLDSQKLSDDVFIYNHANIKKLREYTSRSKNKLIESIKSSADFANGLKSELYDYEVFRRAM